MPVIWATSVAVPSAQRCRLRSLRVSGSLADARWGQVKKAGGAQLVDTGQLVQTVQTEMHEKVWRRYPEQRTAGARSPAPRAYPAGLHQGVDSTFPESDAAYLFNLGAGDRL